MTKELTVKSKLMNTLEKINEKLAGITALESSSNKTNGKFKWNPSDSTSTDIFKTNDVVTLIDIFASLNDRRGSYEAAVKELKLSTYPVWTWQGCTFEDWAHDLKRRIVLVSQDEIATKLKNDKKELEGFLDKEDRLEAVLNGMRY